MADKLLIILANADLSNGAEFIAPFAQATVAAAMEYDVEIVLSARTGQLARKGVAEQLPVHPGGDRCVHDLIKDAQAAGVVIKLCTQEQDNWGDDLIPEIAETVGAAYVISEAMNDDTVTFTY